MKNEDLRYKPLMNQDVLAFTYNSSKDRMEYHPDIARKYSRIIQKHAYFKTEKEALEAAVNMKNSGSFGCQVWAKIGRDEEYFYIENYFILTDDNQVKLAADYIGMFLIYDDRNLSYIINDNVRIDDVVAY